ncbi:cx9C motif-containing protein 4 [Rousettus aegyptiacus]|uniref:Cx9C motif-containing protein 4 n=1 Tax=Rousettus aegyptiacus TaxID=9407 RepID=A0A7J8EIW8_ROUAE|nr:cx9C motif-containing protein 4 [Rousettus aegyptiacus]XP_015988964.1 cx9C motif-containing protein 4 [Rousettus aegyptiacus]KAF6435225.1 C-X9-C motif containing 4 [Rousettus aegyptiacus]
MLRKDPCQKQACEIQKCLQANDYRESKCQAVIQELRKCCARYPRGRSLVCSGFENEEAEKLTPKSASKSSSAETPRAAARFHRATFVYPPDSSGQVAASIE